jgi:hypothetical protein
MTHNEIIMKYRRNRGTEQDYLQGTERWQKAYEEFLSDMQKYDKSLAGSPLRHDNRKVIG